MAAKKTTQKSPIHTGKLLYQAISELPSEVVSSMVLEAIGFDALMDYVKSCLPKGVRFVGAEAKQLTVCGITVTRRDPPSNPLRGGVSTVL